MANNSKLGKTIKYPNPLESLKDIGKATADQMRQEVASMPGDFMEQLLGMQAPRKNFSGEIMAGEAVEMSEVFSGQREEAVKTRRQTEFLMLVEREERQTLEKRTNELRMEIKALQEEILAIAQKTQDLGEEAQAAAMQVTVDPGEYHLMFFEKLLEFIRSFRKKIDQAGTWLHAVNSRVAKKNKWGANYKKSGGKYLLSSEHYLQRSAG